MDEAAEKRFLQPFLNRHVTVGGTWCEDSSHDSKTELHPLDFVLFDPPVTVGIARRPQFIVTSDVGSATPPLRLEPPPFSRTNRVRDFQLAFPPAPPGVSDTDWYQWSFLEEVDASRVKQLSVVGTGTQRFLKCHIESGTDDEQKGFYAATLELGQPAVFVSQSAPSTMPAASKANVTVTMRNTSVETWKNSPIFPMSKFPYNLGSQGPQDNTTWGLGRVPIKQDIPPGSTATFSFTITAPTKPGTYPFQWRMVHDNVRWFGMNTPVVHINVTPVTIDCASLRQQAANLQSQISPLLAELKKLEPGRTSIPERTRILRLLTPLQAQLKTIQTQMTEGGCQ